MITTWALPSQRLRICSRHLDPQQSYWPIENYGTDRISLLCQQAQGRAKSVTIVPFGYAQHGVPIKDAILYLGADIEPAIVIRELTESDLQPPTRSAGNRCKIDRFPILNVGECDVHSDPKHGQEGLLVQKLCNISGGGPFQKEAGALSGQPEDYG